MAFSAQTRITHSSPHALVAEVCDDLRAHGAIVEETSEAVTLTFAWGKGLIAVDGNAIGVTVEAATLTGIAVVRQELASHLIEYAPELADKIAWSGDGCEGGYPAWFCLLTVVESLRLTPHVQRIKFSGADLGRFCSADNFHMRLMFPQPGDRAPQWPRAGANGVVVYPPRDVLVLREYTYRHVDVAAGTVTIDFVLHGDVGPGSAYATRAKPGDVIGMSGPGGGSVAWDRDWYLIAGDETAIPAIARILESLPATARGVAVIEVDNALDEQPLDTETGIDIRWLHREGATPGTTNLLPEAVGSVRFPTDGSSIFAWAGCEFDAFKRIRSYLRKAVGLKKGESFIISYWRKGKTEEQMRSAQGGH